MRYDLAGIVEATVPADARDALDCILRNRMRYQCRGLQACSFFSISVIDINTYIHVSA